MQSDKGNEAESNTTPAVTSSSTAISAEANNSAAATNPAAAVEELESNPYFCHMCNVVVNIHNSIPTCPLCAGDFVEELPTAQPNNVANTPSPVSTVPAAGSSASNLGGWNALRDDLTTLLMSRNGNNFEIIFGDDGNRHISIVGSGTDAGDTTGNNSEGGNNTSGSATSIGGGRARSQQFDRLDNVLFDFIHTLTTGDADGPFGGSQFLFMGNPGDYAWGREGIDTIVTQLLNQMETSGPPPLSKEKIDEIPVGQVSEEEVKNKLQCSVCWESFKFEETIRRLPCSHIYHEGCIIPWLKLHNTCPICRKPLDDEVEQNPTDRQSSGGITLTRGPTMTSTITIPFMRRNRQPTSTNNIGNNPNTSGSNENSTSQGNVFGFDEGKYNLDMDLD